MDLFVHSLAFRFQVRVPPRTLLGPCWKMVLDIPQETGLGSQRNQQSWRESVHNRLKKWLSTFMTSSTMAVKLEGRSTIVSLSLNSSERVKKKMYVRAFSFHQLLAARVQNLMAWSKPYLAWDYRMHEPPPSQRLPKHTAQSHKECRHSVTNRWTSLPIYSSPFSGWFLEVSNSS